MAKDPKKTKDGIVDAFEQTEKLASEASDKAQKSLQNAIAKQVANSEREVTLGESLALKKFQDKKKVDATEKALRLKAATKNNQSLQEFEEMMSETYKDGWSLFDNNLKSKVSALDGTSDALKELTGGLVDLGDIYETAEKKFKAAQTLITAPFKGASKAIDKTKEFFKSDTVKNIGEGFGNFFGSISEKTSAMGESIGKKWDETKKSMSDGLASAGEKLKSGIGVMGSKLTEFASDLGQGAKDLASNAKEKLTNGYAKLQEGFGNFKEGLVSMGQNMVSGAKAFLAKGKAFMIGLYRTTIAMGAQALAFLAALPPMIAAAAAFVGGLIATAASMLVAAAPFIGIGLLIAAGVALLIAGIMYLYNNFETIKATITEKVNNFVTGIKDAVSSITEGFMNVWYSISDWVRGKILKWKGRLFGLSDEEEAELKQIEERQAERKKKKEEAAAMEKKADENAQALFEQMEQNGEFEGMSAREKRKKLKELKKSELAHLQEQQDIDNKGTQEVIDMKNKAQDELYENEKEISQHERAKENLLERVGGQEGLDRYTDDSQDILYREELAKVKFDDDVADNRAFDQVSTRQYAEMDYQKDLKDRGIGIAEGEASADQARVAAARNSELSRMTTDSLAGREDYVASRTLTQDEKDQISADAIGMSLEDYRSANDDFDTFSPDEDAKISAALDRADGDRIRDAGDALKSEQSTTGGSSPVNMATNAVQQNNVSNTTTVREPVVQNLDPTGSRLSAVPA